MEQGTKVQAGVWGSDVPGCQGAARCGVLMEQGTKVQAGCGVLMRQGVKARLGVEL